MHHVFEPSETDKTLSDANVVDKDEPLAWLFYVARFLALFPWKDFALDLTGRVTLKQREGLRFAEKVVLLMSAAMSSMLLRRGRHCRTLHGIVPLVVSGVATFHDHHTSQGVVRITIPMRNLPGLWPRAC